MRFAQTNQLTVIFNNLYCFTNPVLITNQYRGLSDSAQLDFLKEYEHIDPKIMTKNLKKFWKCDLPYFSVAEIGLRRRSPMCTPQGSLEPIFLGHLEVVLWEIGG